MIRRRLPFRSDVSGVATIELALIMPALAGLIVGAYSLWDAAGRHQNLSSALDVGAQYYINGGSDDSVASQAIQDAWQYRPQNSGVSITRDCRCGSTPLSCSSTCAGGAAPSVYVTMRLTSSETGVMIDPQLSASRVVRVR